MVDIIALEAMLVIGKSSSLLGGTKNNMKIISKLFGYLKIIT